MTDPIFPIRLCLVQSQLIVRAGLKTLLNAQGDIEVVAEAGDRKGAFDVAQRTLPDLFLIDFELGPYPVADFLEELLAIRQGSSAILLTGALSDDEIHRAIQAGATGVVHKVDDPEVLIRAIRTVYRGEAWLSRSVMTAALLRFRDSRRNMNAPDSVKIATLTSREREIVALVACGGNRKRIAERLFVSELTVRNHLTSILGKLELSNQFELAFYAQRHGLDKAPFPVTWRPPQVMEKKTGGFV